jgi:hypothetical protein
MSGGVSAALVGTAATAGAAATAGVLGAGGALTFGGVMSAAAALSAIKTLTSSPKGGGASQIAAPEKPPQAAKAPDVSLVRQKAANAEQSVGSSGGNFLTGTGGVDPTSLDLGKSKLLGQ